MISVIVAIDDKRGIANDSGIPWDIPEDKKFFRRKTKGRVVVMGGGTYKEFDEPLPGRTNVVLTKDKSVRDGFIAESSVEAVLKKYKDDFVVIGGAMTFQVFWPNIEHIWLTVVEGDFNCTKFFPEYKDEFKLVSKTKSYKANGITYRYEQWRRV